MHVQQVHIRSGGWPNSGTFGGHHGANVDETQRLLPGIKVNTSPTDFAPISSVQLIKFKGETWERFGEILSGDATN